ncbi:hypothetical protein AVEN_207601-1, partial [Araneus ventricosus]
WKNCFGDLLFTGDICAARRRNRRSLRCSIATFVAWLIGKSFRRLAFTCGDIGARLTNQLAAPTATFAPC